MIETEIPIMWLIIIIIIIMNHESLSSNQWFRWGVNRQSTVNDIKVKESNSQTSYKIHPPMTISLALSLSLSLSVFLQPQGLAKGLRPSLKQWSCLNYCGPMEQRPWQPGRGWWLTAGCCWLFSQSQTVRVGHENTCHCTLENSMPAACCFGALIYTILNSDFWTSSGSGSGSSEYCAVSVLQLQSSI